MNLRLSAASRGDVTKESNVCANICSLRIHYCSLQLHLKGKRSLGRIRICLFRLSAVWAEDRRKLDRVTGGESAGVASSREGSGPAATAAAGRGDTVASRSVSPGNGRAERRSPEHRVPRRRRVSDVEGHTRGSRLVGARRARASRGERWARGVRGGCHVLS
jgi:hypothetical protein